MQEARAIRTDLRNQWTHNGLIWLRRRGPLYALVLVLSVLFAFPFAYALISSLKSTSEWFDYPPRWLPAVPQWRNYVKVWTLYKFPVWRWLYNSAFVVFMATLGTILSASIVAYGFARLRFRGRDLLFMITLGTMMLPSQVTLIPRFIMVFKIGWLNTLFPLWVPSWFGGGAFAIFVLRQFFMTLPPELDEAARIDGAGYIRVFASILLPLCRPAIATVAIVSFMSHWGSFMEPLVYLKDKEKFTIALGLRFFNDQDGLGWDEPLQTILMAAAVVTILPTIVVFFSGQRYFVKGIATTGLKG